MLFTFKGFKFLFSAAIGPDSKYLKMVKKKYESPKSFLMIKKMHKIQNELHS